MQIKDLAQDPREFLKQENERLVHEVQVWKETSEGLAERNLRMQDKIIEQRDQIKNLEEKNRRLDSELDRVVGAIWTLRSVVDSHSKRRV